MRETAINGIDAYTDRYVSRKYGVEHRNKGLNITDKDRKEGNKERNQ